MAREVHHEIVMFYSLMRLMFVAAIMIVSWQELKGQEPSPVVLAIRLENEAITPVTARFVHRALEEATRKRATCLVIFLDTPGGLVDSTREIVKDILRSEIPIVVYIAPVGARAASAGVFITLASHVAAMAPATNIGAAHPVQISGTPLPAPQPQPGAPQEPGGTPRQSSPMEDKIVNDTAAWAQALAERRGRNAEWSVRAVRESISASAVEAVEAKVVDFAAEDLTELLKKIDGREITTVSGRVSLHTASAHVEQLNMWWGERLLSTIANPNIAFLLLILGFYGILFELYTPGWGVAGTVGVISIILGFFALAVLPTNVVGLALILIAFGLFIAEAFVVSYGALTIAGIVCLIMGGLMLVDSPVGFPQISLSVLVSVSLATAAIAAFLLGNVIRSSRTSVLTGAEAIVGDTAAAQDDFRLHGERYEGLVRVHGEIWRARSYLPVKARERVTVRDRDGLTLLVQSLPASAVQSGKETDSWKRIA
jgi:membrane-bound serine protease (ClpP class)